MRRTERARRRLERACAAAIASRASVVPAERVEDGEVLRRIAERLVLVLAGELDEHAGHVARAPPPWRARC